MPVPKFVKNKSKWEKAWDRAKGIVEEQYGDPETSSENLYPIVMHITKNIYKHSSVEDALYRLRMASLELRLVDETEV